LIVLTHKYIDKCIDFFAVTLDPNWKKEKVEEKRWW